MVEVVDRLLRNAGQEPTQPLEPMVELCLLPNTHFKTKLKSTCKSSRIGQGLGYDGKCAISVKQQKISILENAVVGVARIKIEIDDNVQQGSPVLMLLVIANAFEQIICMRG